MKQNKIVEHGDVKPYTGGGLFLRFKCYKFKQDTGLCVFEPCIP